MEVTLNRDATGRPVAIRIRFEGFAVRALGRDLSAALTALRRVVRMTVTGVSSLASTVVGAGIPHVELRRAATGQVQALVLRFDRSGGRTARPAAPADSTQSDAPRSAASQPTVVIEARPEAISGRLRALWRHRGFYGFLFKEITTRKAQGTLLGFWWLLLRPLGAAAGYMVTFMVLAPSATSHGAVPYPIFFLSGFIPFRLFQATLTQLPRSFTRVRGIMARSYFPRLLVPLAGFGQALIEVAILCVVFVVVVAMFAWSHGSLPVVVSWRMLWLVPSLVGSLMFALALGMVFGIVALFFRDVVYSVGYLGQLFMLATPVLYPINVVLGSYRWLLYALNPMAQMVIVSRWSLTGQGQFEPWFVGLAFGTIFVVFALALVFFLRAETLMGDQL